MADDFSFRPYCDGDEAAWNALVAASPNGTFLFDRRFMGYHADRFDDVSLMIERRGKLVAVLPAHRQGERVASHGGLSYGGLVLADTLGAQATWDLMQALQAHWREQGVRELLYKTMPSIYHRLPCEDDRYALLRCGAQLVRRDALSVIGPTPAHWPKKRRRAITLATRQREELGLSVRAGAAPEAAEDWAVFWQLLDRELQARHDSRPVHDLDEIQLLANRFPDQISLRLARWSGRIVAGLVLFDTPTVCHLQYMAADEQGRRCAALDLLLERAIAGAQAQAKWFDFGHSNEDHGRALNAGLAFYKESFGASTVVHDHYLLPC
ncbi:MAG TPA: GNAT family N-acetyltransferase [Ideonella sp.]|uniref:GNAT family N-acetyltransferase n=1 Tax=Ideonella sp. TaxID=1929293 RepID=UPI002E303579|nr:GNAT family N-acetyltransferase [Ideonella sp.]HEX5687192.1 GNAT family N-acetyltransferase [Ideonella sp.]